MSGNHLTVPDNTGFAPVHTAAESGTSTFTGRPRSGSLLSQRSGRSQHSQRSNETNHSNDNNNREIDFSRQPTIRIQRLTPRPGDGGRTDSSADSYFPSWRTLRRRSTSDSAIRDFGAPTVPSTRPARPQSYMPDILENVPTQNLDDQDTIQPAGGPERRLESSGPQLRRAGPNIGDTQNLTDNNNNEDNGEYENQLVEFLDVVDPEVSTLTTLTNVQNSLFVPDLGRYLNRRPTYILSRRPTVASSESSDSTLTDEQGVEDGGPAERYETAQEMQDRPAIDRMTTGATLNTISSRVNDKYFAVLPHGVRLKGWSEEDKLELNDHVRHMLHSRRSKFKRSMKGFGQYVRKPLGFAVTLYATLITLFGLAWVLFLIGWISVDGRQEYLIHIIDSVLVALFAIVGDGLAPFRAVDTYHMCFIAHYHHLTWRLRREQALPKLHNRSDLPAQAPGENADLEKQEYSVLSPKQQKRLEHHQKKFSKSHSFYKPHETGTHQAFSLRLLVAIVVLLDCHSLLQISLGACTWGIDYHTRPFAITTVILCCSITCNIMAGVLISVGDKRSRKKEVIEKMFRQQLTEEAIKKVEKKKRKDLKKVLVKKGIGSDVALKAELSQAALPTHINTAEAEGQNSAEGSSKKKAQAGDT